MTDEPRTYVNDEAFVETAYQISQIRRRLSQIDDAIWELQDEVANEDTSNDTSGYMVLRDQTVAALQESYRNVVAATDDLAALSLLGRMIMEPADEADAVWMACGLSAPWWGGPAEQTRERLLADVERRYGRLDSANVKMRVTVAELTGERADCIAQLEELYKQKFSTEWMPNRWLDLEMDAPSPQRAVAMAEAEVAAYSLGGEVRLHGWQDELAKEIKPLPAT